MDVYWKVRTPYERADSDRAKLYGARRYFATAIEATNRCQELNEVVHRGTPMEGTFSYCERFIRNGVCEDGDAAVELEN